MKFLLIIAIFSAGSGAKLRVHERTYTSDECETMAAIAKAEAGSVTIVVTKCVGVPS